MPPHLLVAGALLLSLAPLAAGDAAQVCVFLYSPSVSTDPTECAMGQPCVAHSGAGTFVHTFDGCLPVSPCSGSSLVADPAAKLCGKASVPAPLLP